MSLALALTRGFLFAALAWSSTACHVAAKERSERSRKTNGPGEVLVTTVASFGAGAAPSTEFAYTAAQAPSSVAMPPPADVSTPPRDARRETCGSVSRLLAPGKGEQRPRDDDRVLLEYATFARSGRPLDSSVVHDDPVAESVRNLADGLPCVVKRMSVGESRRVWLPASSPASDQEEPRSVAPVDLTVDITLRGLTRAPERPADYGAPPRAAQRTATGLRFQVLRRGSGALRPVGNSRVTIYHSGWTKNGVLFESSVLAGQPASYLSFELPAGLSEGIQLMHIGDKLRFWLPERLAYAGAHRTAPKGPVVFDVELLAID